MADQEVLDRLDLIQATLQLAYKRELDQASKAIRADAVSAAILDATDDWIGSKKLQDAVAKKTKTSTRTVRNRLPELVAQRVLASRGPSTAPEYRRTGLI
jgi:hypothetical protein